jgi:hypothetical protein
MISDGQGLNFPAGLDPCVRRLHFEVRPYHGQGSFAVVRGSGFASRVFASTMRLPPETESCPVTLDIQRAGCREIWKRSFGSRILRTRLRGEPGRVEESIGPLVFRFEMLVFSGALVLRQVSSAIRLGRWRLRLPRGIAPTIVGLAAQTAAEDSVFVSVAVTAPWGALILAYSGLIQEVRRWT